MIPEDVPPEIEASWTHTPQHRKIKVTLGDAQIKIKVTPESAHLLPWLLGSLDQVLAAISDDIESKEHING